jgi:thioredoxin reductase
VLIIGGGASGVELAGLMSAKGSHVTVLTRQDRIPFCNPPRPRSPWEKISAPETGLGTSWRSVACVTAPMLFYQLPRAFRHMVVRKHLGPAPGWTSRAEVERNVTVKFGANLVRSSVRGGRARVAFAGGDGTPFAIEADHVIAATGFKVDMRRLGFISPRIMASLALEDTTPMLSRYFETSVPGLFTIGVMAANSFGPLLRFAYGAGFASRRLSQYLARTAPRHAARAHAELAAA